MNIKKLLVCSVDKTEIGLGESFTLSTTYGGSSYNCDLSGNNAASSKCKSSYTILPTATGTWSYTYKVTNGSLGYAECTISVNVKEMPPQITCPDDMEKSVGSTVSVTPKALSGCTNGCAITIEGAGVSENSGYTGGSLSFTGESVAGSKAYTFTVTNSIGAASCSFNVEYKESAAIEVEFIYEGNSFDFEPDKEYVIKSCTGGDSTLTCGAAGEGKTLYANGNLSFTSQSWQSLDRFQSAGSICVAGTKITVLGGTVRCKNQC